ncbi:MAG: carboxypeptidase-like regulatory domain-containing protein [Bernardetiaceae bacterium]|nr:carboxypeptidase-like regulatory domain-containing protein [Bernardetiaceae bacterium]
MLARLTLLFCLLSGLLSPAQAQVQVQGTVRDSASQGPLPFVNIGLLDPAGRLLPIGTSTDIDGRFILKINRCNWPRPCAN